MARSSSRTETSAAVLVRSVPYGDADRIVTLVTETHGKIAVMARGARRSKKRFSGALEPYALIEAEVAMGRGEVGRLAQARVVRAFPGLLVRLDRIALAAAALELVRETAADHEVPDARLLPTIVRYFEILELAGSDRASRVHAAFTLRLLALTGHAPNLERCGRCGRVAPPSKAALFDPRQGAIVCRACGGGPLKLGGGQRHAMIRAGTRAWDDVDRHLDATGAAAIDTFLEWHLGRRLAASGLVGQFRDVNDTRTDE